MAKYFFTAKSLKGEEKSGILEAKDEHELVKILRQEGYLLISTVLKEEKIKKRKFEFSIPIITRGVSLTEKMMFVRNLQVMIIAGIPFPRALKTLALQSKNKKFQNILLEITEEIIKGKNFSDSLAKYPDVFSELFQNMIRVGEESGTLDEVLKNLTRQMEREYSLKSKVKGAMIYPAVIVCAMVGIGILMLVMVVPRLAETFEQFNIELPLMTRIVIGLGTFLAEKWFLAILIIVVLIFLLRIILKTKKGKRVMDGLFLKIPIISGIVKKINSASTIRTLSSLIASGVPIVRSLEIVSNTLGNVYFKEAIIKVTERVRKGEKIAQALKSYENIYPSMIIQMIEVGEETGQTSDILAKLADFYEEEVTNTTGSLTAIIEPVLMVIIGGAIGFFALSMIQPMYAMLGAM